MATFLLTKHCVFSWLNKHPEETQPSPRKEDMSTESEQIPQQENILSESLSTQAAKIMNGEPTSTVNSTLPTKSAVNASILSASELPDTTSTPVEVENKNLDTTEEQSNSNVKPSSSTGQTSDDWVDVLGNQQLMKRVS